MPQPIWMSGRMPGRMPGRTLARCAFLVGLVGLVGLAGCPSHGVIDDGTSISYGPANRGVLIKPARLARQGTGFFTAPRWYNRGLRYGTDEMIALITHVGRQVHAESPGAPFSVADISLRRGGPSAWHRSHQSGRDVDIIFFAKDQSGRDVHMDSMPHFRADGTAIDAEPGKPERVLHFDVERNWVLVRALIGNPIARVQYIFVSDDLRQLLLEHAQSIGESEDLILHASHLLRQPTRSLPHDDHFHVRIYCAYSDRVVGCEDYGRIYWNKKDYKYGLDPAPIDVAQHAMVAAPMGAMMALLPALLHR